MHRCGQIDMRRAEADLRHIAFQVAFHTLYAGVIDHTLRFGRSLAYSALSPIRDKGLLDDWWTWTRGMSIHLALRSRRPIPASIAPIIDAWRESVEARREFDGDGDE